MILFQKDDSKFRALQQTLRDFRIQSLGIDRSAIYAPFIVLNLVLKRRKPRVYVFRYLNDYKSYIRTVLRVSSELLTVLLCKVFNIRIWWICHNVDKETHCHHHTLSNFRRWFIAKSAEVIFTTHRLLIPHAKKFLASQKITNICFGHITEKVYDDLIIDADIEKSLKDWISSRKMKGDKILFLAGTPANKAIHFKRIIPILNKLNECDSVHNWFAIVVGDRVPNNKNVFNIPTRYSVNREIIIQHIDYYFRVIDDLSVSYTIFEAAKLQKPIITENIGFLPQIVEEYNIGHIIDSNDIKSFLDDIESERTYNFGIFLEENNWEAAAKIIASYYYKNNI